MRTANEYLLLILLPVTFKAGDIGTHARILFSMVMIRVFSGVEGGGTTRAMYHCSLVEVPDAVVVLW